MFTKFISWFFPLVLITIVSIMIAGQLGWLNYAIYHFNQKPEVVSSLDPKSKFRVEQLWGAEAARQRLTGNLGFSFSQEYFSVSYTSWHDEKHLYYRFANESNQTIYIRSYLSVNLFGVAARDMQKGENIWVIQPYQGKVAYRAYNFQLCKTAVTCIGSGFLNLESAHLATAGGF
ncbi:MAG TPA: hypothetical protein VJJ72_01335 [Candidatus Paceibacterota bacterium]